VEIVQWQASQNVLKPSYTTQTYKTIITTFDVNIIIENLVAENVMTHAL